ncbi:MAG: SPASM domain-containing protein [Lachnospiraceae bacterium]|nr:SPASM domain-containing protein [Lachnospiraceae bacterium]
MEERYGIQSKVCSRGLNDIWINEYDGKVRMCGWSNFYIGNLMENTIEEIWNGELAQKFRESMLDGSYRYCNHAKCPHCANNKMEDLLVDYVVPEYPTYCSLSYQLQCNYACKFCRNEHYVPCECENENYKKIESEVKKFLPSLITLSANGAGELFCSDSIIRLIGNEELNPNTKILLETNGSLFNERSWKKIERLGRHNLQVVVTVHSFEEMTYQYLSGTSLPVQQVIDNLKFISQLRRENVINEFEIATVICERNFREMPKFVETCLKDFSMDTIRLRFFEPYGVMDAATEWFYDVRNEFHPYHDEFEQVMSNPIFLNDKVWRWQGETKSLQKENPYFLERKNVQALSSLVTLPNAMESINKFMRKNDNPKIALYGASSIGNAYRKLFYEYGINIDMIFDTYACEIIQKDYQVRRPEESLVSQYDLIIVTTDTFMTSIVEELERANYKGKVRTMSDVVSDLKSVIS